MPAQSVAALINWFFESYTTARATFFFNLPHQNDTVKLITAVSANPFRCAPVLNNVQENSTFFAVEVLYFCYFSLDPDQIPIKLYKLTPTGCVCDQALRYKHTKLRALVHSRRYFCFLKFALYFYISQKTTTLRLHKETENAKHVKISKYKTDSCPWNCSYNPLAGPPRELN